MAIDMETLGEKCFKSPKLPSTGALPAQLLPVRVSKSSHREHPPDYFDHSSKSARNGHAKNRSFSCSSSLYCVKNKHLKLSKNQQFVGITKPKYNLFTTSLRSTFTLSTSLSSYSAFKVSQRKKKCSRSYNNKCKKTSLFATVATVLRKMIPLRETLTELPSIITTTTISKDKAAKIHFKSRVPTKQTVAATRTKFRFLPSLGATSILSLLTLVCLETVLLSTMSNCAKTFYMHWNTSNSIFRIDNTDHIIDVNKGNLAFEFDQVHIICPVYEPGTFENETEKYIIYNVSKVEYETCRITNADPRVIAICDKPQKLMFFTITFRPFTPQPGGLEFLPGNDYYFISTSSKDDLYRRIGGRCSTNNMKVVFKVCCAPEEKNKTVTSKVPVGSSSGSSDGRNGATVEMVHIESSVPTKSNQQHHSHNTNSVGMNGVNTLEFIPGAETGININGGARLQPVNGNSVNTNIDHLNRIPVQTNSINNVGSPGLGAHGGSGILLTPGHSGINMIPTGSSGIVQYNHPGQPGIRINNVPSQHHPSHKSNNNDDQFDKHPNEVVKNEELSYNSAASTLTQRCGWKFVTHMYESVVMKLELLIGANVSTKSFTTNYINSNASYEIKQYCNMTRCGLLHLYIKIVNFRNVHTCINPIVWLSIIFAIALHCSFKYTLSYLIQLFSTASLGELKLTVIVSKSGKTSYSPIEYSKINSIQCIRNIR